MSEQEQVQLEYSRGDNVDIVIQLVDQNNEPQDLTDYIVFFTVKEKLSDIDTSAKISKTVTVHSNPLAGETTISLSQTDTNLVGSYLFDIQVKTDNGSIKTIVPYGLINFLDDITKRIV